jgi:Fe-S cluster assembly scaffold protein SufB
MKISFYLRSRASLREDAISMIVSGFLQTCHPGASGSLRRSGKVLTLETSKVKTIPMLEIKDLTATIEEKPILEA